MSKTGETELKFWVIKCLKVLDSYLNGIDSIYSITFNVSHSCRKQRGYMEELHFNLFKELLQSIILVRISNNNISCI